MTAETDMAATETVLVTLETLLEQQLQTVKEMIRELGAERSRRPRIGKRRESLVDCSVRILSAADRPMHVTELVEQLRLQFGRTTERDSLDSALGKKARAGVLLRRTAPATFAVIGGGKRKAAGK